MKKFIDIICSNKDQIIILIDQALVSGSNFIFGILLARFMGLENYGLFVMGWLLVLFVSSIHLAYIIKPLYTLYPKQKNKNHYLANLTAIQIIFSALTFLLVFVFCSVIINIYPEWNIPGIALNLAASASLFILSDYVRKLFFVLHRPISALGQDILYYIVLFTIFTVLVHLGRLSISTSFLAVNLSFILSISLSILLNKLNYPSFKRIKKTIKINWTFSKYLVGTALLQWLSANLFIVIAAGLLGPLAIGAIRIIQNIVGVLHVLFLAMENIVPLQASHILKKQGNAGVINYILKISKQALIPAILFIITIILFNKEILKFLYGQEYVQFHQLLTAFSILYLFIFLGTLLRFVIRTFENNKVIFQSYIFTSITSIAIAKPLISHLGLAGVMFGLFLMQFITIGIFLFTLKSEF